MRPCASTARRPSCTTALEQCAATGRIVQRRDAITDAEIVKHDFTSLLRYLIPMARIMLLCLALVPNSLGLNVGNGPLTRPPALRAPKPTAAGAALATSLAFVLAAGNPASMQAAIEPPAVVSSLAFLWITLRDLAIQRRCSNTAGI